MIGNARLKYAMPAAVSEPQTNDERMFARFCLSTSEADREGDIVDQAGLDWSAHRANPVVLVNHSVTELPIGISQTGDRSLRPGR